MLVAVNNAPAHIDHTHLVWAKYEWCHEQCIDQSEHALQSFS